MDDRESGDPPVPTPPQATPGGCGPHVDILLACAGICLAAIVLRLDAQGRLLLPFLNHYPLPATCLTRVLFHLNCPTCGLTRSFVATAHGEFARASAFHRVGPFLFLLVFLEVPIRAYALLRGIPPGRLLGRRWGRFLLWAVPGALLANWIYSLLTGSAFC